MLKEIDESSYKYFYNLISGWCTNFKIKYLYNARLARKSNNVADEVIRDLNGLETYLINKYEESWRRDKLIEILNDSKKDIESYKW